MSTSKKNIPQSWFQAERFLAGRSQRKVGKTGLVFVMDAPAEGRNDSERTFTVRLHNTNIVTFYFDGRIRIATGGWDTVTTRSWLNRALAHFRVGHERGDLIVTAFGSPGGLYCPVAVRAWDGAPLMLNPPNSNVRWIEVSR